MSYIFKACLLPISIRSFWLFGLWFIFSWIIVFLGGWNLPFGFFSPWSFFLHYLVVNFNRFLIFIKFKWLQKKLQLISQNYSVTQWDIKSKKVQEKLISQKNFIKKILYGLFRLSDPLCHNKILIWKSISQIFCTFFKI